MAEATSQRAALVATREDCMRVTPASPSRVMVVAVTLAWHEPAQIAAPPAALAARVPAAA